MLGKHVKEPGRSWKGRHNLYQTQTPSEQEQNSGTNVKRVAARAATQSQPAREGQEKVQAKT